MKPRRGLPPYQRIAADIRARIESGELVPGDALPSINELRAQWGVARSTIIKALDLLKAEGLVEGVQGWATVVRER